jgi:hypothetical protein
MNLPIFFSLLFAAALPPAEVPFTISASEDVSSQFVGAPRVQSFSFAQWEGRWVFIGGRMAGYHSVGGGMAEFLRADSNRDVWVVDTTVTPVKTYHAPLTQLPSKLAPVQDQWASTGQLYFQDGAQLYIAGGYGQDHEGQWVTYPLLSRVELPQLIDGVMHGHVPAESIAYTRTPLAQATGGALVKLPDGYFYLVMGHSFTGSYTAFEGHAENNAPEASQEYLSQIRKLKIAESSSDVLSVTLADNFQDDAEFHRRDLNVTQVLSPAGLGLAAYGGVFTPKTQLSFSKPVYLFPGSKPVVDTGFDQHMNAYTCPTLLIYDEANQTMYTTFFGGISRHSWDATAARFVEYPKVGSKTESTYLDGLQWSDQISTVRKVMADGKETTDEFVHPRVLPAFIGTGSVFIPAREALRARPGTDILDFQSLEEGRTFVGFIYGGVRASPYQFPYMKTSTPYNAGAIPTKPNDLVLKVYVQGKKPSARPK